MDSRWKQPNLQLSMYFTICALFFFLFRCLVLSNFRWNMHICYRLLLLKICMHNMHIQSTFSSTADTERKHESTRERSIYKKNELIWKEEEKNRKDHKFQWMSEILKIFVRCCWCCCCSCCCYCHLYCVSM